LLESLLALVRALVAVALLVRALVVVALLPLALVAVALLLLALASPGRRSWRRDSGRLGASLL
jgi:hypothetical protein